MPSNPTNRTFAGRVSGASSASSAAGGPNVWPITPLSITREASRHNVLVDRVEVWFHA
jgi:hypothetical protein